VELLLLSRECTYWFVYGRVHAWTEIGAVFLSVSNVVDV